jgi:hypothetical protein
LLVALPLLFGVAACGDDDDDGGGSASGSGSGSEVTDEEEDGEAAGDFCDSVQAFNGAIFSVEIEDDASPEDIAAAHETLDPLWSAVEASAPDEHAETVETLGATIDDLGEGDATAFNADETANTYFGMLGEVVPDCVEETTEVTAIDYAFEDVPATLPGGSSGMIFANESENDEEHEFIIFKKADGETRSAEEILNDPATQEQGPGEFAGAVFAPAGQTAGAFLDLQAGDYLAVCFIPVGGGEEGPPHFHRGHVRGVQRLLTLDS